MWRTWLVINWWNLRNPNSYKSLRHWLYLIIYLAKMVAAINHPWLICYIMININWNISLKIVKLCWKNIPTRHPSAPPTPYAHACHKQQRCWDQFPLKQCTRNPGMCETSDAVWVYSSNSIRPQFWTFRTQPSNPATEAFLATLLLSCVIPF
jgi:hypothetical protein